MMRTFLLIKSDDRLRVGIAFLANRVGIIYVVIYNRKSTTEMKRIYTTQQIWDEGSQNDI
jgi:hypothetical protein